MASVPSPLGIEHVIKRDWSPNIKPSVIGQHWIDKTAKRQWLSVGLANLSDWQEIGGVGGVSGGATIRVDRILNTATFATYIPSLPNTIVETLGYYDLGDGGQATYYIDENDYTTPSDGGSVFVIGDGRRAKLKVSGAINVRWFGAKGDGVTDDTLSIQAALNYVQSRGGGIVDIPIGTYIVSEILVPDNTIVQGHGTSSVLKKKAGTVTAVIRSAQAAPYLSENVTIRSLAIDGNKANCPMGSGINALSGNNITVQDCFIYDTPDAGVILGYVAGDHGNYRIVDNYCLNCSKVGQGYG